MGLNTENAGSVVAGGRVTGVGRKRVEMLLGTFVQSVGRSVNVGEIVEVSDADYRFLKPYNYCKDAESIEDAKDAKDAKDVEDAEGADSVKDVEGAKTSVTGRVGKRG